MLSFESFEELLSKNFSKPFSLYKNEKYIGINTNKENILLLIKFLEENAKLNFNQLTDITAIDYPHRELRFDIIYIVLSLNLNQRIVIKSSIKIDETLESITSIYKSANWYERECYDLFGIKFINHPDLRRIMTDYNFEGHPLRKDFPLTGFTEVRYDNLEKRVVYEPVNLPQEYRNFDYSSPWEGLSNQLIGDEKSSKKVNK
jgi:NADH-quinone oxidoreductase subunit C